MKFYKVRYLFDPRAVLQYKREKGKDLLSALWEELGGKLPAEKLLRYEIKFNEISVVVCDSTGMTEKEIDGISKEISKTLDAGDVVTKIEPAAPSAILNGPALTPEDKEYISGFVNGAEDGEGAKAPAKAAESAGKDVAEAEDVFEAVDALIGMDALKKWAQEMQAFTKLGETSERFEKTVLSMSYLVSVNAGNGRTTIFEKMGKLVAHLLDKESVAVREIAVEPDPDVKELYNVKKIISDMGYAAEGNNKLHVFVLDIEKFQNNVHMQEWIRLLSGIRDRGGVLVIFTLPYLEKRIVYEMHQKISDILPNRMLTIKPFSNEEYAKFFELRFKKADMQVSAEAMELFPQLLAKEKSDGRFYGIDTVNKICDEILFEKLRTCAARGEDACTVTAEDVTAVLKDEFTEKDGLCGMEKLSALVSLDEVKSRIKEIVASVKGQRKMHMQEKGSMHMMFSGAPGTGKTVVARILGQILREEKILSAGGFYEVSRKDLVGSYVGHTAPKTAEICQLARGSVLFIDEAYSLDGGGENDFGKEAISTLIAEMENYRHDFVVIFAGYEEELGRLFALNPGLRDRIPYRVNFASYNREELAQIFFKMLPKEFSYDEAFEEAAGTFFKTLSDDIIGSPNFSNARFVRNLTERVLSKAYLRIEMGDGQNGALQFTAADFALATADAEFSAVNEKKKYRGTIGF